MILNNRAYPSIFWIRSIVLGDNYFNVVKKRVLYPPLIHSLLFNFGARA